MLPRCSPPSRSLRELNRTGRRRVPDDTPTDFVPPRWRAYLERTEAAGRGAAHRHYWELAVLYGLQTGLRSAEVWVPGSRRYADPASAPIPPEQWPALRGGLLPADRHASRGPTAPCRPQLGGCGAALDALEPILVDAPQGVPKTPSSPPSGPLLTKAGSRIGANGRCGRDARCTVRTTGRARSSPTLRRSPNHPSGQGGLMHQASTQPTLLAPAGDLCPNCGSWLVTVDVFGVRRCADCDRESVLQRARLAAAHAAFGE